MLRFGWLVLACVMLCVSTGHAEMILAEINISDGGIILDGGTVWELCFGLTDYLLLDGPTWGPLTQGDIGSTFLYPSTNPYFFDVSDCLISGVDDVLIIESYQPGFGGHGSGGYESEILEKFVETDAVDLAGYEITELALTLNDLDFTYERPEPAGLWWTYYSYDITIVIYGHAVPEPATLILLTLGALIARRRG